MSFFMLSNIILRWKLPISRIPMEKEILVVEPGGDTGTIRPNRIES